ncbi:hypothetical protein [Marinobacterium rhizophilum]|uniref:hypothetical protein n=1 Tax=Marinobacterium rhizophilum TaxID=420402 RepID=UPI002104AE38|nr:hypothetical protein [Marinobacterium rhizophilum]
MRKLAAIALLLVSATGAIAGEAVSTGFGDTTAIGGHDTLAYHQASTRQSHQQVSGDARFSVQ